jgi:hypothetical protein
MKYDDASWHSGGDFPADLAPEAGATHTGMFVAWALLSGLGGELHVVEFPKELERLKRREVAPGRFFLMACDGKFTNENLSDEGNRFAQDYFDSSNGKYLSDYERILADNLPSLYHVPDTWQSFDLIRPVLDDRLAAWRTKRS